MTRASEIIKPLSPFLSHFSLPSQKDPTRCPSNKETTGRVALYDKVGGYIPGGVVYGVTLRGVKNRMWQEENVEACLHQNFQWKQGGEEHAVLHTRRDGYYNPPERICLDWEWPIGGEIFVDHFDTEVDWESRG